MRLTPWWLCTLCVGAGAATAAEAVVGEGLPAPRLRACCAFGYDLKTAVGGDVLPTLVPNVAAYYDLGRHAYLQPLENPERNGIVYSCRGGFIDVSHVRDYADWVRWLYLELRPVLGSGVSLSLPAEGGARTLKLRAMAAPEDRDALALRLAQRITYDLSLWHELATWYDVRSVPIFSEQLSAFSPEDLYSNLVGITLGAEAARAADGYDAAIDRLLAARLLDLEALSPDGTRRAFDAVEGAWWDRSRALPDVRLVQRRRISTETSLFGWTAPSSRIEDCRHRRTGPLEAAVPTTIGAGDETPLTELYELAFEADPALMPRVPRPDGHALTNRHLPWLTARASEEIRATLGPLADREELSVDALREQLAPSPCGAHDPDCSLTRRSRQNGTKILKLEVGTWAGLSFIGGVTIADFVARGGGLQVIDYRSAVEFVTGKYLMRVEALRTTGLLSGCRKLKEDGSGQSYVPLGFVNPVDDACLPGARWGMKVDLLDFIYDGRSGVFGLRPAELGVALNLLANGFSGDFLERRLVWSLNVVPELYVAPGASSVADLVTNTRLYWHQSLLASRLTLGADLQLSWGTLRGSLVAEAVARVTYNQLVSFGSGRDRVHTILSIGFEGGVDWWVTGVHGIAPLNHRSIQLLAPVGPVDFYGVANLVLEISLPLLAI